MYACPSCGARTISFTHKWLSWSSMPAKCKACNAAACIATVDSAGILAASAVALTLCGFAAVAVQAIYPLLLGGAAVVAFYFWRQHRAKLVVVSEADAKLANRSAWAMLVFWLFPGFFS